MKNFPNKAAGEKVTLTFDFEPEIGGDAIVTKSCAVELVSGTDANPSAMLNGSPTVSGQKVYQSIMGGVTGAKYDIVCTITTATETLILQGRIRIRDQQ
jgi:hypothetical protein